MKNVYRAEAIGLTPREEREARRLGLDPRAVRRRYRPSVAELTALHPGGGFVQQPVKAKTDYTRADGRGARGVWLYWTLECGRVYQARLRTGWSEPMRSEFVTVAATGALLYPTGEEVRGWLANVTSASTS